MANKKKRSVTKRYTYEEFVNTFFPNRKKEFLNDDSAVLTKESFLDILQRVSRPNKQPQSGGVKTRT